MHEYYMLNKPAGYITAKKDDKHRVVMEFFNDMENKELHPVGRLDIDTEGLLLITDDGKWNQMLMNPESHVEKEYFFWALGELNNEIIECIKNGVCFKGDKSDEKSYSGRVVIDEVSTLDEIPDYAKGKRYNIVRKNKGEEKIVSGYITITEGKKRQVKRMLKAVGCYVIYLKRVRIGNLRLDKSLKTGEFRPLTEEEYKNLTNP